MNKLIMILLIVAFVSATVIWVTADDATRGQIVGMVQLFGIIFLVAFFVGLGMLLGHKQGARSATPKREPRRQPQQLPGYGQPPIVVLGGHQQQLPGPQQTEAWDEEDDYDDAVFSPVPARQQQHKGW